VSARSVPPPAILDRDGLTLDPTEFAQSLNKGGGPLGLGRRSGPAKQSNGRQLHLLPARRKRPDGRRAAEKGDELASPHGIDPGELRWLWKYYQTSPQKCVSKVN
jgi:hypothetical protein